MKFTEILAVYGAVLSTAVFIWNVFRSIPKFKVDIGYGIEEVDGEYVGGAYVCVRNPSSATVHLASVGVMYTTGESSFIERLAHMLKHRRFSSTVDWVHVPLFNYGVDSNCPISLEAGQSHHVFIPDDIVKEILSDTDVKKLRGSVQDQLWRNKYSSPEVFEINI
ncbi:hypothetical protein HB762_20740 [Vibrio campbellii]|uniref:Uncharacterized protein n=1 Tax=Vibrio campbellii TaxID=680 RepID=A0ABY5IHD2_9VIBR|nr:hypothetical protein [Vibrio campbellii]UTZ33701.1 hypothetical protein HB762_20740 [Vibrio campbellii]